MGKEGKKKGVRKVKSQMFKVCRSRGAQRSGCEGEGKAKKNNNSASSPSQSSTVFEVTSVGTKEKETPETSTRLNLHLPLLLLRRRRSTRESWAGPTQSTSKVKSSFIRPFHGCTGSLMVCCVRTPRKMADYPIDIAINTSRRIWGKGGQVCFFFERAYMYHDQG